MLLEVFEDYAYPEWVHALYKTDMNIEGGTLTLPTDSGLGIDLDFQALEERGTRFE
jgi:L-alanine-DL-glutamate epimerase-like enolase superfamily enzyme